MTEFKNPDNIVELTALWREAFGDSDEFLNLFFSTAYSSKKARVCLIDGKLAAMLYWFECSLNGLKIAYIYAVATKKEFRNKGLASLLLKDTHEHLNALGFDAAVLVPSEDSLFNFYQKLGYETCGFLDEFSVNAKGTTALTQIDITEYFNLRNKFLPDNSVNLNSLEFLNTQLEFFKGDDFILAARLKPTLFGAELLGNTKKAPNIVGALGAKKGVFRTQGKNKPFLMCCSLNNISIPKSLYFAFAFD